MKKLILILILFSILNTFGAAFTEQERWERLSQAEKLAAIHTNELEQNQMAAKKALEKAEYQDQLTAKEKAERAEMERLLADLNARNEKRRLEVQAEIDEYNAMQEKNRLAAQAEMEEYNQEMATLDEEQQYLEESGDISQVAEPFAAQSHENITMDVTEDQLLNQPKTLSTSVSGEAIISPSLQERAINYIEGAKSYIEKLIIDEDITKLSEDIERAIHEGILDFIKAFVQVTNNPNFVLYESKSEGESLLTQAIHEQKNEIVKYLLEAGANLVLKNSKNQKPMELAILLRNQGKGNDYIIKLLQDYTVHVSKVIVNAIAHKNIKKTDDKKITQEKKSENFNFIKDIVAEMGPNYMLSSDYSLLTAAIYFNNLDVVKYLLENGADPLLRDRLKHEPLHLAIAKGRAKAVKILLKYMTVDDLDGTEHNELVHYKDYPNFKQEKYDEMYNLIMDERNFKPKPE